MADALAALGFEMGEVIGRGGFGVVYRARQRRLSRDVAIKLIATELDESSRQRFERECRAVGALSAHPHIVSVYESGTTESGSPFLVMELLTGGTLADRLPMAWPEAAGLGVKVAGALETAHRGGVVHRDVKPHNVLFSSYGEPVVVDFGIASVEGGFETKSSSISATLSHTAPEILDGARSTASSDVYSLASTLFAAITGNAPFAGGADQTVPVWLRRIATEAPPDLAPWGVPPALARAIERGLSKDPADRQPTAGEFGADLAEAMAESGEAAPTMVVGDWAPADADTTAPTVEAGADRRGRNRWLMAGVAAAVLALVVGLVAWGSGDDDGTIKVSAGPGRTTTTTTSTIAVTPGQVAFGEVPLVNGATLARTWTVAQGDGPFTSTSDVSNPTDAPITTYVVESIPKTVAATTADITFDPAGPQVVQEDPVVSWQVTVAPHETIHLTSTVPNPAHRPAEEELTALAGAADQDRSHWEGELRPAFCTATGCIDPAVVASDTTLAPGDTIPETTSGGAVVTTRPGSRPVATTTPVIRGGTTAPSTGGGTNTGGGSSGGGGGTGGGTNPGTTVTQPPVTTVPISAPSAPRSVEVADPQITGGNCVDDKAIASVTVTLSWDPPASNGGAAVTGYDIVAEEKTGSGRVPVSVGAGILSRNITVPRSDQPAGYWQFTVAARNSLVGEAAVAKVKVPDITGFCSWTAAQLMREVGLRPGYDAEVRPVPAGQGDLVFQQTTSPGQVVSVGSILFFKNYASS